MSIEVSHALTVCQWPAAGLWFSPCNPSSSANKADRQDIAEILLKVELNTINPRRVTAKRHEHHFLWESCWRK
jgi:hypothetical protein